MTTLTWRRDGDQYVATGALGVYRITEWRGLPERAFLVKCKGRYSAEREIGQSADLDNAKAMAQTYDSYRASKPQRRHAQRPLTFMGYT